MIGYAFCGSYCTHRASLSQMERLIGDGYDILPIMSDNVYATDTRFGKARELIDRVERLCGREVVHTVVGAEPLGPSISKAVLCTVLFKMTPAKCAD